LPKLIDGKGPTIDYKKVEEESVQVYSGMPYPHPKGKGEPA
jgi:hypothetical protein